MKFRKKPVVIEAEQFTVENINPFGIVNYHASCGPNEGCSLDRKYFIATLEGNMIVSVGDWVIRGVKGEYYPCKPEIFLATYEKVEDGMQ